MTDASTHTSGAINAELSQRVVVATSDMPWTPSPSPGVERKRLYLDGPPEAGRVTSVVRYLPGSRFPEHAHPDGEEIFVLEGTFSDERGDFGPATYMLNPEGFSHAPFSVQGCTIFVRLRQYGGEGRHKVLLDTNDCTWTPGDVLGVTSIPLYSEKEFPEEVHLTRMLPGTVVGAVEVPDGEEIFVVAGSFSDEHGVYETGTWIRLPRDSRHSVMSEEGCTLFVRSEVRNNAPGGMEKVDA